MYKQMIITATGCNAQDSEWIEDYMRNVIFGGATLDWQTKAQFNKAAKTAYKDLLWSKTPEGIEYTKSLTC